MHFTRPFPPSEADQQVEVIDWLNVGARSNEPKRLEVDGDALGDSVENLVEELKKVGLRVASETFLTPLGANLVFGQKSANDDMNGQGGRMIWG